MSLALESSTFHTQSTAATSFSTDKPSGLSVGDLILLQVSVKATDVTSTPSSGFTLITSIKNLTGAETGSLYLYGKIADSGDVAASSFGAAFSSGVKGFVAAMRISGHRPSGYVADYSAGTVINAIPSITPFREDSMLLWFFAAFDRNSGNASAGTWAVLNSSPTATEIYDEDDVGVAGGAAAACGLRPETTATGLGSLTVDGYRPDSCAVIMLLLSSQKNLSVTVTDSANASESLTSPKIKSIDVIENASADEKVTIDKTNIRNLSKNVISWSNLDKS